MNAKYLAEIKAREQAATPGPWEEKTNRHPQCNGEPWGWISGAAGNITWSGYVGKTNADFIAHARTDISALVAEVERLQQEITQYQVPMLVIQEDWNPSKCPRCGDDFFDYEPCDDGYYKRAYSLERCPYCGQKLTWREEQPCQK